MSCFGSCWRVYHASVKTLPSLCSWRTLFYLASAPFWPRPLRKMTESFRRRRFAAVCYNFWHRFSSLVGFGPSTGVISYWRSRRIRTRSTRKKCWITRTRRLRVTLAIMSSELIQLLQSTNNITMAALRTMHTTHTSSHSAIHKGWTIEWTILECRDTNSLATGPKALGANISSLETNENVIASRLDFQKV